MSAIAGLLRFDGGTVTRHGLERAANALRQYGPDRADIAIADGIGLVHVLMRMTPEDQFDRQPWQGASGALITADVRLDNRDEVIERIGITPSQARAWPDSRVLLAAWERFGDALWPMLRGPFAVAIWDSRRRVLTLARDHLGLNVVMWHKSERFFAFATMPNGLFALDDVPRQLSEEKLADFLVLNHADHATTIYRNVFRLPPAHVMKIQADGSVRQLRYWSPADIAPVELGCDQAYADGLRERLDVAVRRQMRSAHPVGCLLSGGLDSSSVSALAARALAQKNERLAAYTGVPRRGFDGPVPAGHYADETPYVDAIARAVGNIDVTYIQNDRCDDFAELERFFIALEGPVRNPANFGWMLATLRQARAQGRRVLLGGFHGNCTISWNGWSQAVTHLLRGRLLTALRLWQMFYRHSPYSRWVALQKLFVEPLLPERLGNWADRRRHPGRLAAWRDHATIRSDFAAAMAVDERAQKNGHDFLYRLRQDERVSALAQVDYVGDWHAAEKAVTGVEVRDPTADIDVVAYCFGVPQEQYLAEGIDRSLIRRAMWGLLPDKILTNRVSGLQAADWYEKLGNQRGELARQVAELSGSALVRRVIDVERLERAIKNWPAGGWHTAEVFQEYNLALTRGVAGGRFLRWFEQTN
jgi:asparagine synthase (glutamine-hydrolysing)